MEIKLRPKLQFFAWKLVRDMHPTRGKLRSRGMSITGDCPLYCNEEESINHILKNYDFTINIWNTIENNCPNSLNYAFGNVDWLEYIWFNKSWFRKNFHNAIEKAITTFVLFGFTEIISFFNGAKGDLVVILELASRIIHEMFVYGNYNASNIPYAGKKFTPQR